ncbi:hypothetical protein LINGRAHAP2_LOCUS23295 [Linum grandiflorum]
MNDCLIDIMLEMVKNNQYQNGTFRPGTYKEIERQLNSLESECGVRVDPHIQSRLKTLKKKYNGVKELRSLSGTRWNDTLKQIKIDPVKYDEYVKNGKSCKGLNQVLIARYEDSMHYEVNATMEVGEKIEKEVQGSEVAQNKEKGQALVSSKPNNKRRRVGDVEAEIDSVSVGKEIIAELKPMMEVFTASLGDALRGETVVEQEPV